jgi:predicted enzyme related to lactoylglutathione lyase
VPERTDPFDALRRPIVAARPRPRFAAELERRLREELHMPVTGATDNGEIDHGDTDVIADPTRHGELGLVHLRVGDADRAMEFFGDVFGWVGERFVDEHVSHYVLNSGVTVRLLDDPAAAPVRPNYSVRDVAVAVEAIEANGGRVTDSEVGSDGGGWAFADDAAGLPLLVFRPSAREHPTTDTVPSADVALVFMTEDTGAATPFYGAVLGWNLQPAHPGSNYYDTAEHVGLFDVNAELGTNMAPSLQVYFGVEALRPIIDRIEALGGHVDAVPDEPNMGPYFSVMCTDDQGTAFGITSMTRG